jgi:hypothetical protein
MVAAQCSITFPLEDVNDLSILEFLGHFSLFPDLPEQSCQSACHMWAGIFKKFRRKTIRTGRLT